MSAVDDEVSMLHRYLRITDSSALQPCRFEQPTRRIIRWILEHAAGTGHRERLSILPIMKIIFDHSFDFRAKTLAQLEPYSNHDALRQHGPPVLKWNGRSRQIAELTLHRDEPDRLHGVFHSA